SMGPTSGIKSQQNLEIRQYSIRFYLRRISCGQCSRSPLILYAWVKDVVCNQGQVLLVLIFIFWDVLRYLAVLG
ncbi:hypothetical protein BgiBS90_000073, partial [Biomphalaria glabrata]